MISYRQSDFQDYMDETSVKVYKFSPVYIKDGTTDGYVIDPKNTMSMSADNFPNGQWKLNPAFHNYLKSALASKGWEDVDGKISMLGSGFSVMSQLLQPIDPDIQDSGHEPHTSAESWAFRPKDTETYIIKSPLVDERIK